MNDSYFATTNNNADKFYALPYFALGIIDKDDTIANLSAIWKNSTGNSVNSDAAKFISYLTDIIERQNAVAGVDTGEVVKSIVTMYEGISNTTLFLGDPVRLFLSTLAAVISMQNAVSDWTQKQNFLRYASGPYLEGLAAFLDVYRLESFPAKTKLRFTLSEGRPVATAIPQGTRATADGKIFFATDILLLISAGELYGEISATCLTYGVEGNGLLPGMIVRIVDTMPFVESVTNTAETTGGSNVEDDESLRTRAQLSPGRFSTAGARLAYHFYALTAHGNIRDVSIVGPEDRNGERKGEVDVFVMLKGGRIPTEDGAEIEAVKEILNQDRVRPLTDKVNVNPIKTEDINYTVTWFITSSQGVDYSLIEERVKAAVEEYETWQIEKIGRDINPDRLIQLCRAAGAKRIELQGLGFTRLNPDTVAHIVSREIIPGDIEGE